MIEITLIGFFVKAWLKWRKCLLQPKTLNSGKGLNTMLGNSSDDWMKE
ncbi:hypothetical protein ACIPIX_21630 [Pseudomonas protegens]